MVQALIKHQDNGTVHPEMKIQSVQAENRGKFCSLQNIPRASQRNSIRSSRSILLNNWKKSAPYSSYAIILVSGGPEIPD